MSNFPDQLIHTTVRIEATYPRGHEGGEHGVATGFLFRFAETENRHCLAIVTNRHVTDQATRVQFTLSTQDGNGNPVWGTTVPIDLTNPAALIVNHPNPGTDLAIIIVSEPIAQAAKQHRVFYKTFDVAQIASDEFCRNLSAVEDILMCGYPAGLWDPLNNLPITRTGTTATPVYVDHKGKREFLVNSPCYVGCSGSPVVYHQGGLATTKQGDLRISAKASGKLLGIQYAVPKLTAQGELHILPAPTTTKIENAVTTSLLYINLGICIKATELMVFEDILKQMIQHAA